MDPKSLVVEFPIEKEEFVDETKEVELDNALDDKIVELADELEFVEEAEVAVIVLAEVDMAEVEIVDVSEIEEEAVYDALMDVVFEVVFKVVLQRM